MNKEIENAKVEEVEGTIEETNEGFVAKARCFMKKNGKKIALGAAFIAGIGVIYAIGKNVDVVSGDVVDDVTDAVKDEVSDVVTDL